MKQLFIALAMALFLVDSATALEVAGVHLEEAVTAHSQQLKLNGYGIRKKLFVKVYIGSLYTSRRSGSAAELLQENGHKLIRMNFLHSRVEKEKITDAFSEGFANNSPQFAGSPDIKKFLALFSTDFKRGDIVDLILAADGSVSVAHNGKSVGNVASNKLARAVLAIYLGDKPADDSLKRGMLGN